MKCKFYVNNHFKTICTISNYEIRFQIYQIQIQLFYIIFVFNRVTVDYHFPSQKNLIRNIRRFQLSKKKNGLATK